MRGSVQLPASGDQSLLDPCTQGTAPEALAFSGMSVVPAGKLQASQCIQQNPLTGMASQSRNVRARLFVFAGTSAIVKGNETVGWPSS